MRIGGLDLEAMLEVRLDWPPKPHCDGDEHGQYGSGRAGVTWEFREASRGENTREGTQATRNSGEEDGAHVPPKTCGNGDFIHFKVPSSLRAYPRRSTRLRQKRGRLYSRPASRDAP